MKYEALLNWRYYVLMVVGMIAVIGIILRPHRRPTARSMAGSALIIPKIIGFGAWYLIFRMCDYWDARGLIPEMSKTMQEEDDTWE